MICTFNVNGFIIMQSDIEFISLFDVLLPHLQTFSITDFDEMLSLQLSQVHTLLVSTCCHVTYLFAPGILTTYKFQPSILNLFISKDDSAQMTHP